MSIRTDCYFTYIIFFFYPFVFFSSRISAPVKSRTQFAHVSHFRYGIAASDSVVAYGSICPALCLSTKTYLCWWISVLLPLRLCQMFCIVLVAFANLPSTARDYII